MVVVQSMKHQAFAAITPALASKQLLNTQNRKRVVPLMKRLAQGFAKYLDLDRNVYVLALTVTPILIALFTWYRLVPLILRDLGASDVQVSTAFAIFSAGFTLLQYPGGVLADRWGRKPLVVYPTYAAALLYVAAGLTSNWVVLTAVLLVVNLMSALQMPAIISLIAEAVVPRRRGMAFGFYGVFISLSIAVGPALGAALLRSWTAQHLMIATGFVLLAMAVVRHWGLAETAHQVTAGLRVGIGEMLKGRMGLLLLAATLASVTFTLSVWGPFVPLFSKDVLGFTDEQINLLFAYGALMAIVASLVGGRIIDRFGSGITLSISTMAHGIVMLLWLLAKPFGLNTMVFAGAFFFAQVAMIGLDTLRTTMVADDIRATALGIMGTVSGLAGSAVLVGAGYAQEFLGPAAPYYILNILAIAAVLSLAALGRAEKAATEGQLQAAPRVAHLTDTSLK